MEIQLMSNNEIPPGIKSVYAVLQYSCNPADGELHLSSAFTDKQSAVKRLCHCGSAALLLFTDGTSR